MSPRKTRLGTVKEKAAARLSIPRMLPQNCEPRSCLAKLRQICGSVEIDLRTQVGFARRLEVSKEYVIKIENGYPMPAEFAERLMRKTGVDAESMLKADGIPMVPEASWKPLSGSAMTSERERLNMTEEAYARYVGFLTADPALTPNQYAEHVRMAVEWVRETESRTIPTRRMPPRPFTADDYRKHLGRLVDDRRTTRQWSCDIAHQAGVLVATAGERGRALAVAVEVHACLVRLADAYGMPDAYRRALAGR